MTAFFQARRRVRFAHCDPAGMAYYPRYLELCDGVIEDWCEAVLLEPRARLHLELGLGLPTARMEAEFSAPSRLGDWLDFTLQVTSLGRSSIGFSMAANCAGERRFAVTYVQVLVDLKTGRPLPWRDEWRDRIEGFGTAPGRVAE